jgi:NitT/TauT family transport system ATP-binding protein
MSVTLRVEGVAKSFVRRETATREDVLRDFTLRVEPDELVAVIGPSGAGKSTLLHLIAGLQQPDAGSISLERADGRPPRIGIVFQQPRLLDWCDVATNVRLAVEAAGIADADRAVAGALADVGLTDYARAFPSRLSGGQRQRASIARAFAIDPDLVLFDEPFSALGEITARKLRALTQSLWLARPRTGILVTHNTLEAAFLADRVVTLHRDRTSVAPERVDIARPRSPDDPRLFSLHNRLIASLA